MSSETLSDVEYIHRIVQLHLGGTVQLIVDRSPGFSGSRVYAVDVTMPTGQLPCIVKLIPDWGNEEDQPHDEQATNRVYGSRATSFAAAYTLLHAHAIPLPQLYAACTPQPALPYSGEVMTRFAGEVVRTGGARLSGTSRVSLDHLVGRYLGAIHRITRSYYGWADLQVPYPQSWRDTFFTALHIILERACVHTAILQHRRRISEAIDQYAASWIDPAQFVLSHGDGLQGMLVPHGSSWILNGVIDIEDHCFTDPRFALAVYEVIMNHAPLEESFWEAYQEHSPLDDTYTHLRPLFQIYVLLDWLGNVPLTQGEEINKLTHQIVLRCETTRP